MVKKSYIYLFLGLFLLSTSYVAALEQPYMPSGKVFLTLNWDLSLKGNGFFSKASIIDPDPEEKLNGEPGLEFYSYNNFFLKSGYMFTDDIGSYINVGLSERAFELSYTNFSVTPSIDKVAYYYQQYYHLEAGCRINMLRDTYIDIGAYYGIQKGNMTARIRESDDLMWGKAKKGDITIKEDSDTKINNDFGITAAIGILIPIVEDSIYFDVSMRFINGLYPAFKEEGKTSGDSEYKLYNTSLGLVLGITATF